MAESVQVYVALGCNLGERLENLVSAKTALQNHPDFSELKCSSVYETEPMGPPDQPHYLNAVVGLKTSVGPHDLLRELQRIEHEHGRVRDGKRWGPRTLDLDLLLYGQVTIESPTLSVPHPGIAERSFVLLPLQEIAAELVIPNKGAVAKLVDECPQFGIRQLNSIL